MLTFAWPRPGARRTVAVVPPERCHLTVTAFAATDVTTPLIFGGVASYFSAKVAEAWLPAWSVHVPVIVPPAVSGPGWRTGAVPASLPDVASVPPKETETGWLCQPAFVGCRPGAAVTVGGVASYLIAKEPLPLVLPALSRQVPEAVAVALSGAGDGAGVHQAMPGAPSAPPKEEANRWGYQPLLSGGPAVGTVGPAR